LIWNAWCQCSFTKAKQQGSQPLPLSIFVKCLQPTSKEFKKIKKRKPIQKKQNPIQTSIRKKKKSKKKQNPMQTSIRKKQKKQKKQTICFLFFFALFLLLCFCFFSSLFFPPLFSHFLFVFFFLR